MKCIGSLFLIVLSCYNSVAQSAPTEVIYGHKDGLALTMLMQAPIGKSNGKAVINIVSGNWTSTYENALRQKDLVADIFAAKGYRVFSVMPGSQPRYNIAEQVKDIKRSVRYIRYHAADLQIDAAHIGITGRSSGGHLALVIATMANDKGDSSSTDPVDKVSDRVQAAAVFFPPTDFLNYGMANFFPANNIDLLRGFKIAAAFDFKTWDSRKQLWVYATAEEREQLGKQYSPVYSVTPDDAPALLIHGDKDLVVPLQQSQTMTAAYEKEKVPVKLIIKPGAGHGWKDTQAEDAQVIAWFELYLK